MAPVPLKRTQFTCAVLARKELAENLSSMEMVTEDCCILNQAKHGPQAHHQNCLWCKECGNGLCGCMLQNKAPEGDCTLLLRLLDHLGTRCRDTDSLVKKLHHLCLLHEWRCSTKAIACPTVAAGLHSSLIMWTTWRKMSAKALCSNVQICTPRKTEHKTVSVAVGAAVWPCQLLLQLQLQLQLQQLLQLLLLPLLLLLLCGHGYCFGLSVLRPVP